jgi:hypothetical protein
MRLILPKAVCTTSSISGDGVVELYKPKIVQVTTVVLLMNEDESRPAGRACHLTY